MSMNKQEKTSMKRVLAIHDLSGFGHTSLMAVLPILYRMGLDAAVLPSALLSANTDFANYRELDTTSFMLQSLEHWHELGLSFDAVFTGFLGNPEQARVLSEAIPGIKGNNAPVLVDPVLGDDGKLYSCYAENMVKAMRQLIAVSDIITPNLTEAALLLGMAYPQNDDAVDLYNWGSALAAMGPNNVVITSVPSANPNESKVYCYDRVSDTGKVFSCRYLPIVYPGAGDCFSSLVLGGIMNGYSMWEAVEASVSYLSDAIAASMPIVKDRRTGIALARVLATNPLDYYSN